MNLDADTRTALTRKYITDVAPTVSAKALAELALVEEAVPNRTKLSDEELAATLTIGHNILSNMNGTIGKFLDDQGLGTAGFGSPEDRFRSDVWNDCRAQLPDIVSRVHAATRALQNTVRGRYTKISRSKNAAQRAKDAEVAAQFIVGEAVECHAFGTWYRGTVKSFNKNGRAVVTYTSGTGVTRDKTMEASKIRKLGAK